MLTPASVKVTPARGPVLPLLQVGATVVPLGLLADDGRGASVRVPQPWLVVLAARFNRLLGRDDTARRHEQRTHPAFPSGPTTSC